MLLDIYVTYALHTSLTAKSRLYLASSHSGCCTHALEAEYNIGVCVFNMARAACDRRTFGDDFTGTNKTHVQIIFLAHVAQVIGASSGLSVQLVHCLSEAIESLLQVLFRVGVAYAAQGLVRLQVSE